MKRSVCYFAVLALAALPDWASAFFHPCWPPPPCVQYSAPPPFCYPQPLVVVPQAVPVYEVPLAAPRVYVVPPAGAAASPKPRPEAEAPATAITPAPPTPAPARTDEPTFRPSAVKPTPAEPVRPAPMAPPMQAPPTIVQEPPVKPDVPPVKADMPPTKVDVSPTKADVPPVKADVSPSKADLPLLPLPATPEKADPKPTPSTATPSPAPAPADPGPTIPPTFPMIPIPTEPKKPSGPEDALPPLVLPPEGPGAPSGIVPPVTSRSSPLTGAAKVQVFATAGTPTQAATRKIGFFNHTDRDITLVVQGQAVKLPRKTYLHAEVPPTFKWKHGDNVTETATVPDGAAGLDVLFRE